MQGTPLVNVLVLLPGGGFIFLKVIALQGMYLECPTLPTFDLFLKVIALPGADFCRGVTMSPFCTLIFTFIPFPQL